MEEKERYELFGEFGIIHDTSPNAECMLLNKFQTCEILNKQDKENQQLKQQLEEKEKERHEEWKTGKEWKWEWHKVNQKLEKAEQDKISFALEQLENVKKFCEKELNECDKLLKTEFEDDFYIQSVMARESMCFDFRRTIDNQINGLKGEK